MILNLFGGVCFLFSGQDKGSLFGLGLVYAFFFIPLSFVCWFRPAYKAFRNDSSFNFMLFFFVFFCQFLFSCIMALGIPGSGGSGIIAAIGTFNDKDANGGTYFVGFLILCVAVGFTVAALADFFMLTKVILTRLPCLTLHSAQIHGYYRATGASLSKAQAEFTSNVLSNEGVRCEGEIDGVHAS
jgi:hypothetical protein